MVVMDDDNCMVDVSAYFIEFRIPNPAEMLAVPRWTEQIAGAS